MAIVGLRHTENFSPSEVRPKDWREGILLQYPNGEFPLFALTSQMKKESVSDPEFNWFEKRLDARRLQVNGAMDSDDATLVVDEGAKTVVAKTLLYVEATGEILIVTEDPSSDTSISVSRGAAGTTAGNIADNGKVLVIGTAFEEGSLPPTGQAYDPFKRYNYTQIFRRTLEMTGTAEETELRTGDALKEAKREALEYISIDIERSFWFGHRAQDTFQGKPRRFMGGVLSQLSASNIFDASAYEDGVSFDDLEGWMKDLFKYGSSEKMVFSGDLALLTVQRIIRQEPGCTWTFTPQTKEYGMNVSRLVTPFGTLVWKTCPLFSQSTSDLSGDSPVYGFDSYAFVLDMARVKYVYLRNRDLKYQPNLTETGMDGTKSGYICECSIKIEQLENHGLIKNLAKAKDRIYKTEAVDSHGTPVVPTAAAATGVVTIAVNPTANDTVTIADKTYKFVSALSAANDVKIGTTAADTIDNLEAAVNAGTGSGTAYGTGTTANSYVKAEAGSGKVDLTVRTAGSLGNGLTLTASFTSSSNSVTGFSGGAD